MKKLIVTLICMFLIIPCQVKTIAVDADGSADFNNIEVAISDSNNERAEIRFVLPLPSAQKQMAIRYRIIEGSTLTENIGLAPPIIVPIRGSFWLKPTGPNPLFSNYVVRGLRFTGSISQREYTGQMQGTYRIGGEFALMEQMMLEGRINEFEGLKLDSGLVIPQAKFPWIEIDLFQIPPDPFDSFGMHLVAVAWPAMWFSTEHGFHPSDQPSVKYSYISDGDLLSSIGTVVRTNHQLTSRLGIMPIVPDLGLDAVLGRMPLLSDPARGEIWFSAEDDAFSESLGCLVGDGDLLSDAGRVVRHNIDLIRPFSPMLPVPDYGLDAVTLGPDGLVLFSTEEDFFSERLGVTIGHGDLLCEDGSIFKSIGELLANFQSIEPRPIRFGLDAVYVWPHGEVWFSIDTGFTDGRLGYIGDGDLLSDTGRVVARNLALLGPFGPIERLADFGLDSLHILWPCSAADLDFNGAVDLPDFAIFAAHWRRIDCGICGGADLTGDGKVMMDDVGEFTENWLAEID